MSVRKSPNDRKLYRVVKLDNGLVALLIEDHVGENRVRKRSGSRVVGGIKKKEGTSQGDLDTEDLSSACALCVNVGSFCDPPDVPGMAHLLEHMLFMGSHKYPGENALDVLTNRYGGYNNASTGYERTTFTLMIHNKHLKKALDMFAHFFASPQLLQGCLDREIEAVDSEFQTSIQKDPSRLQQLLCTLARPDHPYSKFMWGNAKSLKEDLEESNIDLRARLREFYSRWYSSHYMTLLVHSSDSLDVLEEWVRQSFSAIPRNDLPSPEYPDDPPFDRRSFNKLIKVVPVKNMQEVHMTWVLPSLLKYYRTKPQAYLSWLLGHKGKGSILSYLKKRNLATSIEAGCTCNYSCFSLFYCCITLTDKGFANVDQCVLPVFQYLKMLQEIGPQERVFQEIQIIEENYFNYQEDPEPDEEYMETLCENMQLYPEEEYLTGEELLTEYNPECIAMVTNLLTPDRVNVMWLSKSFSDECVVEEKLFGIKYSSHDLPRNWINGAFEGNTELALPIENIYIAMDFSLIDVLFPSEFPMLVDESDHHKLWYKPDNIYRAWVGLVFATPIHMESAQNAVLIDLFMSLFSYVTSELTYEADIAGLEYSLKSCHRGLTLTVSGFSQKFPMFFKALIDELVKFLSASAGGDFQVVKEQKKKKYQNDLLRPEKLCKSSLLKILEDINWNALDRMEVVDNVTLAQLHDVMSRLKRSVYIEALIQGNLEKEVALDLMKYVSDSFNFHESLLPTIISPQTLQFPSNKEISYCIPNGDPASPNTVITDYYQCCPCTERDRLMSELVVAFMNEPCFDSLRTKKQLGYDVSCDWHLTHGVVGLTVTIITQTKKHSASYVSKCMEKFVQNFSTTFSSSRKKSEFDAQVKSVIQDKLEPDFDLGTEVSRNWEEITNQWYQFDRQQKDVEIIKAITKEEMGDWLRKFTLPGKDHRKLTIQVVSRDGADCATVDQGSHGGRVHLTPNDLGNFKQQLPKLANQVPPKHCIN